MRDNSIEIAKTSAQDEGFSEACMRAGTKFFVFISMGIEYKFRIIGIPF